MTEAVTADRALDDLRVIDLAGEIGGYAAKLLVDLGAEVIRVEPPAGDPFRRRSPFRGPDRDPAASLYAAHYHAGKRSVTLDLEDAGDRGRLLRLIAEADVLLESFTPSQAARLGLDWESLRARNPALVVTSITPFGRTGPWAEYAGTDLIGFAAGGMLYLTGEADRPPVRIAGEQAYHFAGLQAAAATLTALAARSVTGRGQHADVSMQAAIASAYLDTGSSYYQLNGLIPRRNGTQHIICVPFVALPCADGYFHWGALETHQWRSLIGWLAETEDVGGLAEPELETVLGRLPFMDYVNAILIEFGRTRTKRELFVGAQQRRLPATPINQVSDLLSDPHLQERGFFTEIEAPAIGARLTDAGSPFRMMETPGRIGARVPAPGQDNAAILDRPRPDRPPIPRVRRSLGRASGPPRALDGLRVIDFTWAVAGPMISRYLAIHGAEVIKVESGTRADALRLLAEHPERVGSFVNVNAGKRSVTIDLNHPDGIDLIHRLVKVSDIVLDNFSPRVMPKLGLDHESLRRLKPDLITLSLPGFGAVGPYRDYVSYGPNIMSVAGLTDLTGYPDGLPTGVTFGYADYLGGAHGVVAVLAALHSRDRTGRGQHIDLAQFEAAVNHLGPAILEATATGREPGRIGNRDPDAAPHGVYPCAGEDRWCAIVVREDAEWPVFARLIGRPDLAAEPDLATLAGRQARAEAIDAAIAAWTADQPAETVMAACQAAGIAAAAVATIADLLERDPQLAARGYYEPVDHPHLAGLRVDGATCLLSETPAGYRGVAGPTLGNANDDVFRDLLGLDAATIDRLTEAGAINRHLAPWA